MNHSSSTQFILSEGHFFAFGSVAALELCVLVVAIVQLVRLEIYSRQFQRSLRAKKAFHIFLACAAAFRIADAIFVVASSCWRVVGAESWTCWNVNDSLRRLSAISYFTGRFPLSHPPPHLNHASSLPLSHTGYVVVVLHWADFSRVVSTHGHSSLFPSLATPLRIGAALLAIGVGSYLGCVFAFHTHRARKVTNLAVDSTIATLYCIVGVGIAWYGSNVIVYVCKRSSGARPVPISRLVLKLSAIVAVASVLLVSRSLWLLIDTLTRHRSGRAISPAEFVTYFVLFDLIPAGLMIWMLWPVSKQLQPFPRTTREFSGGVSKPLLDPSGPIPVVPKPPSPVVPCGDP